eukprot:12304080-Ditylum_brightwellii.AAC.1
MDFGWSNFMKGPISHHWCQAQADYCRSFPRPKRFDSCTWSIKLIQAIWTIFVDVWNACNAHLRTDMDQHTQNVLDKQVRKAFALKHSMTANDCLLFYANLEDHLKSTLESKQMWLESVCIAVHDFTVVHKCTPSQLIVTDFFSTVQTAPNQPTSPNDLLLYNNADTAPIPALV